MASLIINSMLSKHINPTLHCGHSMASELSSIVNIIYLEPFSLYMLKYIISQQSTSLCYFLVLVKHCSPPYSCSCDEVSKIRATLHTEVTVAQAHGQHRSVTLQAFTQVLTPVISKLVKV